jgi:hypothetical protein
MMMKVGSFLLQQLERCGLSAKLADDHAEASDDASGFRLAKIEIARAFAANDQPTIPEADAALHWLAAQPGRIVAVGEPLDLIDQDTGEVLVSGRPGAVLVDPVTVVFWKNADAFDDSEPENDLGQVAMGLAVASDNPTTTNGQPFRVATLAIRGMEVFARRSSEFATDKHPALLARIKAVVGRPRIACPGDWCGACRQAVYCPAWLARAKTALAVMGEQIPSVEADAVPQVDLTNDTAGAFAERIEYAKKAAKLAEDLLKRFVRNGGKCIKNGKEYYLGPRDGMKTAKVADLEAAGLTQYIKKGQPFEMPGWRKPR